MSARTGVARGVSAGMTTLRHVDIRRAGEVGFVVMKRLLIGAAPKLGKAGTTAARRLRSLPLWR